MVAKVSVGERWTSIHRVAAACPRQGRNAGLPHLEVKIIPLELPSEPASPESESPSGTVVRGQKTVGSHLAVLCTGCSGKITVAVIIN